jgi:two-component system response regulator YesN
MRLHRESEKQLWVDSILSDFLRENLPAHQDLPREIREVLAHIHQHLFDLRLNVRYLKSSCRIHDNNVSSRFRYLMGLTIKQYVETLRMEAASRLLRREGLCIFDVSVAVGYYTLQTFYRAFERHHGCTPAKYRHSAADPSPQPDEH